MTNNDGTVAAPRELYKYRAFDANTLGLICSAINYYADPRLFNDPMDCDPTIDDDVNTDDLMQLCYRMLCQSVSPDDAENQVREMEYNSTEDGDHRTDPSTRWSFHWSLCARIKEQLTKELGSLGVLSLSETWDSPLMWSHYADQHKGVCIRYRTDLGHPRLKSVNYQAPRAVKASDLIEWKLRNSIEAEKRVLNTYFYAKSPQWEYEKEWHDLSQKSGGQQSSFVVSGVICGMNCPIAVVITLVHLLSHQPKIELLEIYAPDNTFRLDRRPIEQDEILAMGIRFPAQLVFKAILSNERGDS